MGAPDAAACFRFGSHRGKIYGFIDVENPFKLRGYWRRPVRRPISIIIHWSKPMKTQLNRSEKRLNGVILPGSLDGRVVITERRY
jgi:hypothetical protein